MSGKTALVEKIANVLVSRMSEQMEAMLDEKLAERKATKPTKATKQVTEQVSTNDIPNRIVEIASFIDGNGYGKVLSATFVGEHLWNIAYELGDGSIVVKGYKVGIANDGTEYARGCFYNKF